MYDVSAQGVDEHMINVHYYRYAQLCFGTPREAKIPRTHPGC